MADNVTTEDLEKALQDLAESMGISVKEFVEGGFIDKTTYGEDKAAIIARLDAIDTIDADDDIESIAEKLASIRKVLSDDEGALQGILNLIKDNQAAIVSESDRAKSVEAGLRTDVDNAAAKGASNEKALNDYKTEANDRMATIEGASTDLNDRVLDTESQIATITGDGEGSIAAAVAAETARAKNVSGTLADLVTEEKGTLVGAINEVQSEANVNAAGISAVKDRVTATEDALTILNGDDTVEGSVAKAVKDATGGDISDLSDRMDATEASTGANTSAIETLNGDDTVEGSVAKAIKDAAAKSNVVTDALSDRIDDVEAVQAANKAEAETALTDAVTAVNETIAANKTAAEEAIQSNLDALNAETVRATDAEKVLGDRTKVVEDILNDTTDADDNLVKGIVTRTSDLEASVQANLEKQVADLQAAVDDMKAYSDSNDLKAASMDMCSIGNKFRSALGLGDSTCDGSSDDDDAL